MRYEYKYLVPNTYLADLRKALLPYVEYDGFVNDAEIPEYTVRSIYYDSDKMDFYHEKLDGLKTRKKLRIRGYNEFDKKNIVFLEIKRKYENFIGKNRSALRYEDLAALLKTGEVEEFVLTENGFSKSVEDGERFLHHMNKMLLKPIVLIVYDREAFFSKFNNNLRITFDKNIRYYGFPKLHELYDDQNLKYAMPNHFVFEIKFFNGFPSWLSDILQRFNLSREAVSKYTICLDSQKIFNPMRRKSAIPFVETFYNENEAYMEDTF